MTEPITTPEEMLEVLEAELNQLGSEVKQEGGMAILLVERHKISDVIRALRSRIAPPDPRHEGLRERIERILNNDPYANRDDLDMDVRVIRALSRFRLVGEPLLRDCLAALEPAAPQPTAEDDAELLRRADVYLHGWENVSAEHLDLIRALRARVEGKS